MFLPQHTTRERAGAERRQRRRRSRRCRYRSVAAEGFQAPSVVVSYTDDADIQTGKKFAALGMQIAAGVPLMCDEPDDFRSFRIGLFGLDKLHNVDRTVESLSMVLDQIS